MIKIRFFSSFCDNDNCINVYKRICDLDNDPLYNTAYCFVSNEEYTHAIIINTAMPLLTIPKENVIGLAFEPLRFLYINNRFIEYAVKYIGCYYIGQRLVNFPDLFKEHYGYMWHTTPLLKNEMPPVKNKVMSLIISMKMITEGHKYRHLLCYNIVKLNLPIDIYGTGCEYYKSLNDTRIKGGFKDKEPYLDYLFHISIENTKTPHYFSEKITNSLLCQTIPIYWGCTNIDSYFPDNVINLSGDINNDIKLLQNICSNPEHYKKQINVEKIKKNISITNLIQKINWI